MGAALVIWRPKLSEVAWELSVNVSVNLSVKVTVGDQHLTSVDWPLMTECGLSAPLSFDQSERCSLVNPNTGRVERSRRLASELSVNVSVKVSVVTSI